MKKRLFALATVVFLGACSSGGTGINVDGTPNGEIRWPDPEDVKFDNAQGTFPNLQSLALVQPNMTRDELYHLIGRPHFTEGFHVREWTYLFHFRTPGMGTNNVSSCEYKVLFDAELMAQSYFWRPIDPVDGFCPPKGKSTEAPKQATYTLGTDALFAFDQSSLGSMSGKARAELNDLINKLNDFEVLNSITINGHTDRLGSDAYNQRLSQRRANIVTQYLAQNGVAATKMTAHGYGESQPVKKCAEMNRAKLIKCLQPNRRVEVIVDGYGIKK